MILLAAAFMLPKIEQTRSLTLSKQFLLPFIPERYITLFSGSR
jgi:hypothetical protein